MSDLLLTCADALLHQTPRPWHGPLDSTLSPAHVFLTFLPGRQVPHVNVILHSIAQLDIEMLRSA